MTWRLILVYEQVSDLLANDATRRTMDVSTHGVVHVCFAHHQFSLASEPVKGLNSRLTTGWLNQRVGRRTESHLQLSLITVIRARKSKRLPVVFTRAEVKTVLDQMHGEQRLIAVLMYGTGMRLMECLLCLPKSASGL